MMGRTMPRLPSPRHRPRIMPNTQLPAAAEPMTILDFDAWREQTLVNMLGVEKRYPPPLLTVVHNLHALAKRVLE